MTTYTAWGIAIVPVFQHIRADTIEEAEANIKREEWEFQTTNKLGELTGEQFELLNRFLDTLQVQMTGIDDTD